MRQRWLRDGWCGELRRTRSKPPDRYRGNPGRRIALQSVVPLFRTTYRDGAPDMPATSRRIHRWSVVSPSSPSARRGEAPDRSSRRRIDPQDVLVGGQDGKQKGVPKHAPGKQWEERTERLGGLVLRIGVRRRGGRCGGLRPRLLILRRLRRPVPAPQPKASTAPTDGYRSRRRTRRSRL